MEQQEAFRAPAEPTCHAILQCLQRGARGADELGSMSGLTGATVSHHFAVLKRARLVRTERRGRCIGHSLDTTVLEDLARFLLDLVPAASDRRRKP